MRVTVKYPEYVEQQLEVIDKKIATIYEGAFSDASTYTEQEVRELKRRAIWNSLQPYFDLKYSILASACPQVIMDKETFEEWQNRRNTNVRKEDKETED